jgi:hypothetical protein
MSRGRHSTLKPFPVALLALLLLSLIPTRFSAWAGAVREPVTIVIEPVSRPLAWVSRRLRPAAPDAVSDPRFEAVSAERDDLAVRLARARSRVDDLERLVADLQRGLALAPELEIRAFAAPVTGMASNASGGAVRVGAGRREGVVEQVTVAVTRGVHLVGRVIDTETRSSMVLPITHPDTKWIEGRVMVDDPEEGWPCQLMPLGDGTLRGDLAENAAGVEAGQVVRLRDPSWPESAQMLVLGRVVAIDQSENLRLRITVRPEIDPRRVSEVVLRVPVQPEATGDTP